MQPCGTTVSEWSADKTRHVSHEGICESKIKEDQILLLLEV